uniref:acidic repeat-containing protein n=1 Tax=Epinephelus lanceolatus TaxID=310571 RepID=UPI001444F2CE|nr:acidic repeat-containing protein [Epinephelus lanceolatus]XP_033489595.1 acidic repeat-containing protein [Epinephelus lanceolatus]XP_033500437.1 acidic repeat-containing protein-like [Epinephelus lanceolatus]XP_033500439.1 acidic repeat-containing protein-like [Epinephelus lanceolatus]
MNKETRNLFERIAKKMGWDDEGGLDTAEKKLISSIGKTRHGATSSHHSVDQSAPLVQLALSDSEDDPEKENKCSKGNDYRNKSLTESSDDDFDQFLVGRATPKAKPTTLKPCSAAKKDRSNVLVSSDDDDGFETFLQRVKTPNVKHKKSESGSEDSLKNFIVDDYSSDDDFIDSKSSFKVPKKSNTPAAKHPLRRPLSQCDSPVFISDSDDDDDNIVVKSTWRTRHLKPKSPQKANTKTALRCDEEESSPLLPLPPAPSPFSLLPHKTQKSLASPRRTLSAPSKLDESASSEEEFTSLLERLKKKNKFTGTSFSPRSTHECNKEPPAPAPPVKGLTTPASKSFRDTPLYVKTQGRSTILKPTVSQTEPRHGPISRVSLCKTPGCFLQSLSNPGSNYGRNFKQNKEELTSRLYQLYNTSVFDSKLPVDMSVTWNKKMRKTAGYCVTGQERGGGSRYARIELSEKVCDSADRLRDTLIHEMCHAATWLINGVRDGHGNFWKLYARKSTVAHPELPMVTRCHSYDIKYKFQYQCTRCQNTIGRHSKSLDTQRFVCALCTGQLVLLTPGKPRAPTPFANFVKENYGTVRQELSGQSHAEVMRKLSADFASKTKLSQS